MSDEEKELKPKSENGKQPTTDEIALEAARVRKKHFESMTDPLKRLDDNINKLKREDLELAVATKEAFKAVMRTCGANRDKIIANREKPSVDNSVANKELWEEIKKTVKNFYWPENLQKNVASQLSDLQGMMEQKPDLVNYMADLGAEGKVEINNVMSDVNTKQAELDKDVKDATSDLGKEEGNAEQNNQQEFDKAEMEKRQEPEEEKRKTDGTSRRRLFAVPYVIQQLRGVKPKSSSTIQNRPLRQVSRYVNNLFGKSKGGRL